jgi:hypothetical protein
MEEEGEPSSPALVCPALWLNRACSPHFLFSVLWLLDTKNSLVMDRESLVYKAKLAEQAER